MKNFGNRIKVLRRKMNLTQEELSERLNVSFQTVSKWETNASLPDITMFPILANFFNVTTDELLGVDLVKKQAKIDEILEKSSFGLSKEKLEIFYEGLNIINENLNKMIEKENLDVRTITLGISLLDCIDSDLNKVKENIYNLI